MQLRLLPDTKQRFFPINRMRIWIVVLLLLRTHQLPFSIPELAAAESEDDSIDETHDEMEVEEPEPTEARSRSDSQSFREIRGAYGRIGHIAFPTFGRNNSITNVELVPFIIDDNEMMFFDARFYLDNEAQMGANGGAGYRRWLPTWNRVIGSSLWYDFDETSENPYHQTGLSLESYGRYFDLRGNGYVPVGDREQNLGNRRTNFRYQGNRIVFDHLRSFTESQAGFDTEIGVPMPSGFGRKHNLRVFGGYYHFLGDDVADINGVKGRLEGSINDRIDLQVEATKDNTFGTNVTFGVAFNFGTGPAYSPQADEKLKQLTRYVNRNFNIITSQAEDNSYYQLAINPLTGQPYSVQHVSSSISATGSGTQTDPFATIEEAQAFNPDLVLVHAGSVLNSTVVLSDNQRVLGEGVDHFVNVYGIGNVLLPPMTGGTTLPVLRGSQGDAVTLASGSEFSGFVIDAPTGSAILGNGITGATVRNVAVQNASGDGIFLANSDGSFLFEKLAIRGVQGDAFHVNGGAMDLVLSGAIDNSINRVVRIENTTGGTLNLEDAEITDNGGRGILLANNAGNVAFGNVTIENSTSTGIDIQGGTGLRSFTKETTILDSTSAAFNIENAAGRTDFNNVTIANATGSQGIRSLNSPTTTTFANLTVSTENAEAIFARNGGVINISDGSAAAANASAVDLENTNVDITLASLSSTNATNGIRIVNSVGSFVVYGDGTLGSGGSIQGASVGVLAENAGTVALQNMILNGNGMGVMATNSELVAFHSGQIINSASHAFNLRNVQQFELYNSVLSDNGGGAIRAQFDAVGDYSYSITNTSIDSALVSPIVLSNLPAANDSTLSLTYESNTISMSADGSQALDLDWNGMLVSSIAGNTITGSGASNVGFDIAANSTTQLAQLYIGQNQLTFAGDASEGTRIATSGASEVSFGQNAIVFNAANGVGANFAIGDDATIDIFSNAITDNVSRGTGMLFSSINGTSNVTINNNSIQLLSTDNLIDRGIIFNSVTGDVEILGTSSNAINGATTPFSAVGTTGQIIVNGVSVP